MTKLYRIEIDVFLDDGMRAGFIAAARKHYRNTGGAWTREKGRHVSIPANEIVVDAQNAFIVLVESVFRLGLPGVQPHAFRCGVINGAEPEVSRGQIAQKTRR